MIFRFHAIAVKQLPQTLNEKGARLFFRELESCMNIDRPRVVFDCSKLLRLDRSALHLLLTCLEEAMKRNGDVKLAAIPAGPRATLQLTGADRLFEIFDTNADAVNSFRRLPVYMGSHLNISDSSDRPSQNAA